MEIIYRKLSEMKKLDGNPRKITPEQLETLKESILNNRDYFEARPLILSDRTGELVIIAGNQRYEACRQLGIEECPTVLISGLTEEREKEIIIRDNVSNGEWDEEILKEWDSDLLDDWGVDVSKLDLFTDEINDGNVNTNNISLADKFGILPFSVLDTRKGRWLDRRRIWIGMGLKSEIGRDENLAFSKTCQSPAFYENKNKLRAILGREPSSDEVLKYCEDKGMKMQRGTSIFDPVLCELMYRWFNIPNGVVIDPFAGGSVRGVVASKLGMKYNGCDLRQEQINSNYENANEILSENDPMPNWVCGDSMLIDEHLKGIKADMIMTCPPYADLEVYSDDPKDLSTMGYNQFLECYRTIIKKTAEMLKPNRFAVFVVGEVRGKDGYYYNFVGDTIKAVIDAGLKYYNEVVLVNSTLTLPNRIAKYMDYRKIGKHHQNVIVFYKPGQCKIKDEFPPIDISQDDINKIMDEEL